MGKSTQMDWLDWFGKWNGTITISIQCQNCNGYLVHSWTDWTDQSKAGLVTHTLVRVHTPHHCFCVKIKFYVLYHTLMVNCRARDTSLFPWILKKFSTLHHSYAHYWFCMTFSICHGTHTIKLRKLLYVSNQTEIELTYLVFSHSNIIFIEDLFVCDEVHWYCIF